MDRRLLVLCCAPALLLVGCIKPTKPEVSNIDASLPFNQAMQAAIQKDEFMSINLRAGFHRAADGSTESFSASPDEHGSRAIEHVVELTRRWCTQNGGSPDSFMEIPVLQRGDGYVVDQRVNRPVVGDAHNIVCYKGKQALGAAAVGRNTYFLNSAQFAEAMKKAGGFIVNMKPLQ